MCVAARRHSGLFVTEHTGTIAKVTGRYTFLINTAHLSLPTHHPWPTYEAHSLQCSHTIITHSSRLTLFSEDSDFYHSSFPFHSFSFRLPFPPPPSLPSRIKTLSDFYLYTHTCYIQHPHEIHTIHMKFTLFFCTQRPLCIHDIYIKPTTFESYPQHPHYIHNIYIPSTLYPHHLHYIHNIHIISMTSTFHPQHSHYIQNISQ